MYVCMYICMSVQVNKVNATVVDCACINEVKELNGREVSLSIVGLFYLSSRSLLL